MARYLVTMVALDIAQVRAQQAPAGGVDGLVALAAGDMLRVNLLITERRLWLSI
jgi:hypothetical protein